ncbi:hypothetical protein [Thalassobellus citreus]|uniref:hypothetical protein n=1 Tax=Thalassobellus citreus TaxID=3367752 RepID=UPI0037985735
MKTAVFKSYENGFYTFWFDNGNELVFEEVHPRVLSQFNLKTDKNLIDKEFKITFVEHADGDDVIYTVQSLKPL